MESLAIFFIGLSLLYTVFAVGVVVRLWKNRRQAFDDHLTPSDRRLVAASAFYVLTPITVALHELGHAVATWAFGGRITGWGFLFFLGWVVPERTPPFTPFEGATISLAGNAVSLAIGVAMMVWTARRPSNAAKNLLRLELARIMLVLTLILYPLGSVLMRAGDFHLLREDLNRAQAHLGDATLAVYGVIAFAVWRKWRSTWRARYAWLTSPLYDRLRTASRKLEADPQDTRALTEVGRALMAGGQPTAALAPLEKAAELRPDDPEARYLAGTARLALGDARDASAHLRAAGEELERMAEEGKPSELQLEVTLALAGARLGLGDVEGALLTAEAARELRPFDARTLLMLADVLIAAGRGTEARGKLEAALESARGAFAHEIRRRLDALPDEG